MKIKPIAKSVKVVVDIRPGPASAAQMQAWTRFWKKLVAQMKAGEP
jgi:hypothetical protein